MYNYTYLCGWITSAIIVSPMPLIRTCIVGFVRIFPTDFGRSLRRWVLMSNAQVLRGRSVCLVMLDQRIVDLACVIAILRQTSYKQGKSNPAESTVSHAGTKLAIMQLRSPTPNAPYSFMQIIQQRWEIKLAGNYNFCFVSKAYNLISTGLHIRKDKAVTRKKSDSTEKKQLVWRCCI